MLALLAGLALFGLVLSRFPFAQLIGAAARIGPLVSISLVFSFTYLVCTAGSMRALLDRRVPFGELVWARFIAESYNALFASIGGEPFRIRYLTRWVSADEALAAVVRERVIDLTTGYLVSGVFILAGVLRLPLPRGLGASLVVYACATTVGWSAICALALSRHPARLGAPLLRWLFGSSAANPEPLPWRLLLRALPWLLASRLLELLEVGILFWWLGGAWSWLRIGFSDSVLNAAQTIGFFVPQALGVYEGSSVFVFALLGLPAISGMMFGLAHRARMLLVGGLGITLHWLSIARKRSQS
jgi:hypothetical protein